MISWSVYLIWFTQYWEGRAVLYCKIWILNANINPCEILKGSYINNHSRRPRRLTWRQQLSSCLCSCIIVTVSKGNHKIQNSYLIAGDPFRREYEIPDASSKDKFKKYLCADFLNCELLQHCFSKNRHIEASIELIKVRTNVKVVLVPHPSNELTKHN